MATVTTQERTNILKLVAGMFNAAPGAAYLNEFTNAFVDLNKDLGALANALGQTGAFQSLYPSFLTADEFANKFLDTLGLKANTEAQDWVKAKVNAGESFASVAFQALVAIDASTADDFKAARDQLANKATVAEHYSVTLQASSDDLAALQNVVAKVTDDPASVTAANEANAGGNGKTFTLTTGVDNLVGGAGNDTFNAPTTDGATPVKTLGGLDNIDGGAGVDTLNVDDTATGSGVAFAIGTATIKNVENVNIATTGTLGAAGTALDLSGLAGAAKFDLKSQDTGAASHAVKVADTADLSIVAGAGTVGTVGGKVVSVAAPGVVTVKGDALTAVTVKGAASASTVENTVAGAGVAGTTLTSVTFDGITTGTATAKGDALNAVTIKNQAVALATTLTNTATEALTVNVDNAGYNTTTKALVAAVSVDASTSANYKTVTVNSTGVNQLTLTAADATSIKATGAGNVTLTLTGLTAAATSFDGSAATGNIALGNASTTTFTSVKTGSGNDSFDAENAAKVAIDTGAGNDTVSVDAALAAGTTIALGAGDDKLLFKTGSVANSTATATTLVDGGEGTDTLALELVGAANIGVFKNFEVFDVVGMTAKTLDLDILATNNTVTGLTGSGTTTGAVTLTNVGAGVGFTAVKNMVAAGTVAVKTAPVPAATEVVTLTQKTAGALTVKVDSDSTSTTTANDAATSVVATNATSLKAEFASDSGFVQTVGAVATENNQAIILEGTKAVSLEVVSGGTNATNLLSYTIGAGAVATDGVLTSATVNGSQALTLDFALKAGVTTNKLATVDASALTGSLTFDLADLANAGTLKLGSGADVVKAGGVITTSADIESVENFTKAASNAADAVKVADILDFTANATVGVEATPANAVIDVAKGVVTFLGTGPTTLDQAIQMISTDVTVANSAVAFQYLNDTYVVQVGATANVITDDVVVKLVGVTGVTELAVDANANVYLV